MMDMLMKSLPKVQQINLKNSLYSLLYYDPDLNHTTQMAHEIATPMSKTNKITMVTANGETGAARLTGEVLEIMTKMPELVKSLTGVDVAKVFITNIMYIGLTEYFFF